MIHCGSLATLNRNRVWRVGCMGQRVFKFYRMCCNTTDSVLTQSQLVEDNKQSTPLQEFLDSNCLFNNMLKECFQNLLLCID